MSKENKKVVGTCGKMRSITSENSKGEQSSFFFFLLGEKLLIFLLFFFALFLYCVLYLFFTYV